MIKTESQIEQDFYDAIKGTELQKSVTGKVYKFGLRPFGSTDEDIVIKVTTANAEQMQEGVVTILTYCNNIDGIEVGRMVPNKKRLAELEVLNLCALEELKQRMPNYVYLRLENAVGSRSDFELKQSFISMRIKFKFLTT